MAVSFVQQRSAASRNLFRLGQLAAGSVAPAKGKRYLPKYALASDDQLQIVMTAGGNLPVEKRGVFLERVVVLLFVARDQAATRLTP
jgi:hypothetical protein